MIIAIDFDNTIMNPKDIPHGKRMGNPMQGTKVALEAYKAMNHTIIVHSHRAARPEHMIDWLNYFEIPFDEVTNIKPNADIFIDDRAKQFTGWNIDYLQV